MSVQVRLFEDSAAFMARAEAYLLQDEAVNSLMLGAATAVSRQSINRRRFRPLFALVEQDSTPVAALLWTLRQKPILAATEGVGDEVLGQLVQQLNAARGYPDTIFGPAAVTHRFAALWAEVCGLSVHRGMEQRLLALREVSWPAPMADGAIYPASFWNRKLLGQWIQAFHEEAVPNELVDEDMALIIVDRLLMDDNLFIWLAEPDGRAAQPVAMAARARPSHNSIAVNLVYTPPELRRHGYASALVASLSGKLLDSGWQFCTLFTDLANATSNHIYQSIGYRPVQDFTEYILAPRHTPLPGANGQADADSNLATEA